MKPYTPSDESNAIREHILPIAKLAELESNFPGVIDLVMVRRERARVSVNGKVFLNLAIKVISGSEHFQIEEYIDDLGYPGELFDLIRHRAASAMLALRKGHREYRYEREQAKALLLQNEDRDA